MPATVARQMSSSQRVESAAMICIESEKPWSISAIGIAA
jgi:hypothetical protein